MDYEEKYRDALEIARKINNGECVEAPQGYSVLETIFPELREPEKKDKNPSDQILTENHTTKEEPRIDEESNPMNEAITMTGAWITNGSAIGQLVINHITNSIDYISLSGELVRTPYWIWTIKCAKDGDVLVAGNNLVIFRKTDYSQPTNDPRFYVCYNVKDDVIKMVDEYYTLPIGTQYYPANKKQAELLFRKIKESNLVWDEENKELRKVDSEKPKLKIRKDHWYVCIKEFKRREKAARVGNVYQSEKDDIIYCDDRGMINYDRKIFIDTVDGVAADYFREWTIEDAVVGDLLVCHNPGLDKTQYGVFKHHNSSFDHDNVTCFKASVGLDWDGKLIVNDYMGGSVVHPSTIKQREQLKSSLKDYIRNTINQRPLFPFNIGDTIIHKDSGGDYIHKPHKIVRIDIVNKKYYLEDGNSVNFSEQDDYELLFD